MNCRSCFRSISEFKLGLTRRLWKVPYYWAGSKFYDLLAGSNGLSSSYFLSKSKAVEVFPTLREDALQGAIVYYDGI